jgi:hypothetical protein
MKSKPKAVFLHTGYRTAGTWLWSFFRRLDGVAAYYEPLHEMLATIDAAQLATSTANSWRSNHPKLEKSYFAEFAHLLRPGEKGIPGYEKRSSIDSFTGQTPDGADGIELYLRNLTGTAHERGSVLVFKFCRSLGQLQWFRVTFPDAVHIVVEKNPISRWQSCWDLLATDGNPHFVAVPFAVLALNRHVPLVTRLLDALNIDLPEVPRELENGTFEPYLARFKQHVMNISPTPCWQANSPPPGPPWQRRHNNLPACRIRRPCA